MVLSAEQQRVVTEERESHPNSRIRQRMLVLWAMRCGLTREKAAELAGIGRTTVERMVAAFREGGLDAVRRWNVKGPASEMAAYGDQVRKSFEGQPVRSAAEDSLRRVALNSNSG